MKTIAPPRGLEGGTAGVFRAKGLVYRGAQEFYEGYLPGGLEALRGELQPELASFFLDQSFLASSWHDLLPIEPISRAAAKVKGVPPRSLVRANAAWIAKRDMKGVHRFILRLTSPAQVVTRLPRVSMQYFDFGDTDGQLIGDKHFETTRVHIPEPLADWMLWCIEGFSPVVLEAAGARSVVVKEVERRPLGRSGSIPTVKMRIVLRWT